jgi:capsid protein
MKKYSQKELLKEGFWQGVGTFAKRAGNVAKYAAKTALPKTTKAVTDVKNAFGNVKTLLTGGEIVDKSAQTVTPEITQSVKQGLLRQNIRLSFKPIEYQSYDQATRKHIYKATVFNSAGKPVFYYVDKDGVIYNPQTLNPQTSTTPAPTPPTTPAPTPPPTP